MPAYLFQKFKDSNGIRYVKEKRIPLAGHNAIQNLWVKKDRPFEKGWAISSEELIKYVLNKNDTEKKYSIIIDSAPSVNTKIDYKELHDIHLYTFKNQHEDKADWSVILLRVRDVYGRTDIKEEERSSANNQFYFEEYDKNLIYSFLYLHGDYRGWNWGRLGQMNGAWIYPNARKYFSKIFDEFK